MSVACFKQWHVRSISENWRGLLQVTMDKVTKTSY